MEASRWIGGRDPRRSTDIPPPVARVGTRGTRWSNAFSGTLHTTRRRLWSSPDTRNAPGPGCPRPTASRHVGRHTWIRTPATRTTSTPHRCTTPAASRPGVQPGDARPGAGQARRRRRGLAQLRQRVRAALRGRDLRRGHVRSGDPPPRRQHDPGRLLRPPSRAQRGEPETRHGRWRPTTSSPRRWPGFARCWRPAPTRRSSPTTTRPGGTWVRPSSCTPRADRLRAARAHQQRAERRGARSRRPPGSSGRRWGR